MTPPASPSIFKPLLMVPRLYRKSMLAMEGQGRNFGTPTLRPRELRRLGCGEYWELDISMALPEKP